MDTISRDVLIKAAGGGIEAFEEIYRTASSFVYTLAMRVTNNRQDAQDVTHEVFVKIYRNLKSFAFRASFKTWVYRIAVNTAINHYRRTAKERKRQVNIDDVSPREVSVEPQTAQLELHDRQEKLKPLLDRLNPDQRTVIMLREIEGLSYEEIAKALSIPINTVRSRLKRARQALMAYAVSPENACR